MLVLITHRLATRSPTPLRERLALAAPRLRWWSRPVLALAALLFTVAHGDLFYTALILPTGLWFGWVGWRTGSVFPAMFCHATNDFTLMVLALSMRDAARVDLWIAWNAQTCAILGVSAIVLLVSVRP